MITYSVFKTLPGWMGVVQGEIGVKKIILPHALPQQVGKIITEKFPDALQDNTALQPLTEILDRYFRGKRISGDIPLDWSASTSFSVTVWRTTQSIPWGEVRTYKWLSHRLERPRSFRAVGGVLGKNPFPIVVPCHRVVRSDGRLGGFSAPTGTQLKRKMLEMEGVRFDRNGKVIF